MTITRSQILAERAADTAERRYLTAPYGRKLYRLTIAQSLRLRALKAGIRAKERARG